MTQCQCFQVLAEARRVVNTLDREDAQRRRAASANSTEFLAATALHSMAHKVITIAASPFPSLCVPVPVH